MNDSTTTTIAIVGGIVAFTGLTVAVVSLRRTEELTTATRPDDIFALAASLDEKEDGVPT